MKDIWTVIKFTMRDLVSRKSFRISTIIILILIVLGFNLPNIISNLTDDTSSDDTVLIVDRDNLYGNTLSQYEGFEMSQISDDEARTKVKSGEVKSAVIVTMTDRHTPELRYIVKNLTANADPQEVFDTLIGTYPAAQAQKLHLPDATLQQMFPNFQFPVEQVGDQEIGGNIGVAMVLSCLLFFAIYFCAFQVSSSITIEKTSKIMETLVTSTSPRTIVLGKTIGIGIVGLLQILLFTITAIIMAYSTLDHATLTALFNLDHVTLGLGFMTILYFILGYFVYALLYAVTGATVSKPEDVQSANTPVVLLTMISFYLAYFTLMDPTSNLNIFAALFPFSSAFCMPIRIMMGAANSWEIILSVMILIITCIIVARVAIKIYSNAILNYGNKMSLKDIIKSYRNK